jgi:hypothetical protein
MSHAIGDGHMFYTLYNMLADGAGFRRSSSSERQAIGNFPCTTRRRTLWKRGSPRQQNRFYYEACVLKGLFHDKNNSTMVG